MKIHLLFLLLLGALSNPISAQILGANFNHNAEILDVDYLKKSGASWVRATPRILDYADGKLAIKNDPANDKIIEAGKQGYKVIFGFRWDFAMHKQRIPQPGSPEETRLFDVERQLLDEVGPYIDVFTLGNEPNLETLPDDMIPDAQGHIPLVVFMERQLVMVVEPYFKQRSGKPYPQIFLGSLPALFEKKQQQIPANVALIKMAQNDPRITGFDLHLHILDFNQAAESFAFARAIMPQKPIIVTEFSLHRLFLAHRTDPLNSTPAGVAFAKKYGRDPAMKVYEWCGIANRNRVSPDEWEAMFMSRSWYIPHYLKQFEASFKKNGVTMATYPLFQQSCPENMTPDSPMWFINPIFCQKSLEKQPDGTFSANPLSFDDFKEIAGKN